MRSRTPFLLLAALLLVLGCAKIDPIAPEVTTFGDADFSSYVAMGTSVSMGIQSGGLLDVNQLVSAPALIARQTGANGGIFVQPLVASPGIPNLLTVASLAPLTLDVLPGSPPAGPYVPRPPDGYDNLSISGAVVANAIAQDSGLPYFDLVLQGHGPMVRQAIAQNPTFVTVELGANDAVRPLLLGGDLSALIPVPTFALLYSQVMDSLAAGAPGARLAVANIPQVSRLPYATTVPLDVEIAPGTTVRLRDAAGPLPDGSLILLPAGGLIASGYGFPSPAPPLPDSLVITVAERSAIETAITGFNAAIAAQAQAHGAALVDEFGLFDRLDREGILVAGVRYRFAYVTGGLFSLDGVHPSSLSSGILANAFLTAINRQFGARIPLVNLSDLVGPPPANRFPAARAKPTSAVATR
jgi:lysophospholipase L1-like esterase